MTQPQAEAHKNQSLPVPKAAGSAGRILPNFVRERIIITLVASRTHENDPLTRRVFNRPFDGRVGHGASQTHVDELAANVGGGHNGLRYSIRDGAIALLAKDTVIEQVGARRHEMNCAGDMGACFQILQEQLATVAP
jgi:hypothetical protein